MRLEAGIPPLYQVWLRFVLVLQDLLSIVRPDFDKNTPLSTTTGSKTAMTRTNRPLLGISCLVAGLFLYSVQDMVIRSLSSDYSLLQIMWIRGAVSWLILLIAVFWISGRAGFSGTRVSVMLARGLLGALAYIAYYLAIVIMPLAEAVAIVFTAPIMVTVFSAMLFGERVGPRRWMAVILGFCAVLIVLGPQGQFFRLASGLAAFASVTYAGMVLLTGMVKENNSTLTITYHTAVGFMLAVMVANGIAFLLPVFETDNSTLIFLLRDWELPETKHLVLLIGLGIITTFAQFALIKAYSVAPMSAVAPFEYSYIIWAVLFGYLFWNEIPSVWTWTGLSLLILCNLYILYREGQVAQREA